MIKEKSFTFLSSVSDRLDKAASLNPEIKRSIFSRPDTKILLNGSPAKKSAKVKEGDEITLSYSEDVFEGLEKEDIPLDVLYEDDDVLVINKPQGLVVHPGAGVSGGTLANALLYRYGDDFISDMDETRPGIVHRLDKDTSGIMVVAKNDFSLASLAEQFKDRQTKKWYLAIAKGFFTSPTAVIEKNITRDMKNRKLFSVTDNPMKGKSAKTEYKVLKQYGKHALLLIRIYTGRTHQIRVHLKSIGHPVAGDVLYSSDKGIPLMLHSYRLMFHHPRSNELMDFRTPLPERFTSFLGEDFSLDS